MKKIFVSFIAMTLWSCSEKLNDDDCPDKLEDSGLIEESFDFCGFMGNLDENSFIINDSIQYDDLQKKILNSGVALADCSFPLIDFDSTTVLGLYADAGGCTVHFNRSVEVDSVQKTVRYKVSPVGCGECEMLGYSYNFISVKPKISEDYNITFLVE